jgi:pilus assembly protein CpaC
VAEPARVTLGKSTLIKLPAPVVRMVVGGLGSGMAGKPVEVESGAGPAPAGQAQRSAGGAKNGVADADIMLLSPTELYVIGKRVGSMNLILQSQTDQCTVMDISVAMDATSLQAKFAELMPGEKNIKVSAAEDTLIVSGEVADAIKVERALTLAAAYAPDKRVVNLLRSAAAHQVMLEVKVAEVSRTILDQIGARVELTSGGSGTQYSLFSNFLSQGSGVLEAFKLGKRLVQINGEVSDGVVRVLAEPNIMAVSGQQASFLSGGKIFIPVSQTQAGGFPTITLEEKEFGVGVKFTPTVLEGNRINLKVASEVSELSQTGSPFTTTGGVTSILPSFTTRRADTTVQLKDGQSFAIAGLIKNNLSESMQRFPGLGDIPILGALFRSAEFQKDLTELLFIITPRLVKPLPPDYALPTDAFKEPARGETLIGGKLEADRDEKPRLPAPVSDAGSAPVATEPAVPAAAGPVKAPQPVTAQPALASAAQPAVEQAPETPVATTNAVPLPDGPRLLPASDLGRPPARSEPQAKAPTAPVVADAGARMSAEAIGRFYAD